MMVNEDIVKKRKMQTSSSLLIPAVISIASIILILAVSMAGIEGRGFRDGGDNRYLAGTPLDAYNILKEKGGSGRVVICLSLHSHSAAINDADFLPYKPFPIFPVDLIPSYAAILDGKNLLWVLMQEGVIRKVVYAVPPGKWKDIAVKVAGNENTPPPLDINYRGSPILLYPMDTLPKINEPVILFIDGSAYSILDPSLIEGFLREKGIRYDLAVATPGFDNG